MDRVCATFLTWRCLISEKTTARPMENTVVAMMNSTLRYSVLPITLRMVSLPKRNLKLLIQLKLLPKMPLIMLKSWKAMTSPPIGM